MKKSLLLFSLLAAQSLSMAAQNEGNTAAQFDGQSYIQLSQPIPNKFTFAAWVKQDNVSANNGGSGGTIVSWGASNNDAGTLLLDTRNNTLTIGLWNAGTSYWGTVAQQQPVGVNQWVHVAYTYDGTNYKLYKNGVQVAQGTLGTLPTFPYHSVGAMRNGPDNNKLIRSLFQGLMDDVVLFPTVFTAEQVNQLKEGNSTIEGATPIYYLPFQRRWTPEHLAAGTAETKNIGNVRVVSAPDKPGSAYVVMPQRLTLSQTTAIGTDETIVRASKAKVNMGGVNFQVNGDTDSLHLQGLKLKLDAAATATLQTLRLYMSTEADGFATRTLLQEIDPKQTTTFTLDKGLYGNARLSIEGDFTNDFGNYTQMTYSLESYTLDDQEQNLDVPTQTLQLDNKGTSVTPEVDTDGLIRNPAMGWVLYLDAMGQMNNESLTPGNRGVFFPEKLWEEFDASGATQKASIFYMRVPWSFVEPSERNYAWNDPESAFSRLVKGARDRGLKLAFRINVNSTDSYTQATPNYVFRFITNYVIANNGKKNAYISDPEFRYHFERFLKDFGKQFNDPDVVDYIDGMGLGNWGEGHSINTGNGWSLDRVLDSVAVYYRRAFPDILLGMQEGSSTAAHAKAITIPSGDGSNVLYDIRRRDSFGMRNYYGSGDITDYSNTVVTYGIPLMAENGWNYFGHRSTDEAFQAYTASAGDRHPNVLSMLNYTLLTHVIPSRANTFDFRVVEDAAIWMQYPDLVNRFIKEGGYRLAPTAIEYGMEGRTLKVSTAFANLGIGVLPNRTPAWRNKYMVALALINPETNDTVAIKVTNINPGYWLNTQPAWKNDVEWVLPNNIKAGTYKLGYAIVDTHKNNKPSIRLAVKNVEQTEAGWYVAGIVKVNEEATSVQAIKDSHKTEKKGVYTLNGVKVANNGQVSSELPKGVYVVNGKKVVK